MKFTVEIDDEETMNSIEYQVAEELARRIESSINIKEIKSKAVEDFDKKKDIALRETKMQLQDWDKTQILFDMKSTFDKSWIKEVADKVIEKLKGNSDFIAEVSSEIIKSKFK